MNKLKQQAQTINPNKFSLDNFECFKLDVLALELTLYPKLIEDFNSNIKVSANTAIKHLPNLFNACMKIGNSKGFDSLSLRDLSQETGMSLGAIYTYIRSKEDLIQMLHAHHINTIEKAFEAIDTEQLSNSEKLFITAKAHLYLSQIYRPWFYFAFTESKHLSQQVISLSKKSELKSDGFFQEILIAGVKDKSFTVSNKDFASAMIKALLQDWYLKPWKYQSKKIDIEDYFEHLKELLIDYLKI